MTSRFRWTTFDLASLLPDGWQRGLLEAAAAADFREYPPTPILTREAAGVRSISRGRLHAADVRRRLPWLYESYHGSFLELAREAFAEPVMTALDERYSVVLNVQRGTAMRFECHVDSNPLTGLLFGTDHHAGAGGELVFAHDPAAASISAVEQACSVIRPRAGHLIFFDGRTNPHYVRPLTSESELRVVAVMNFYTASCPESTRPPELNRHLFQQVLRLGTPDLFNTPLLRHELLNAQFREGRGIAYQKSRQERSETFSSAVTSRLAGSATTDHRGNR